MLVAEGEVVVYEVADGLRPRPAERRMSEEAPSLIGKAIGLTIAAAKQEQQVLPAGLGPRAEPHWAKRGLVVSVASG